MINFLIKLGWSASTYIFHECCQRSGNKVCKLEQFKQDLNIIFTYRGLSENLENFHQAVENIQDQAEDLFDESKEEQVKKERLD